MVWVDVGIALSKSEDTLAKSLMNDYRGGACSFSPHYWRIRKNRNRNAEW